jgi:hypothetical protein
MIFAQIPSALQRAAPAETGGALGKELAAWFQPDRHVNSI